jgi:thiol-disulfide isomerase/thioredoxin
MKNPILLIVIVAVVAAIGLGAYALSQNSSPSNSLTQTTQESTEKTNDEILTQPTDTKMADSRYIQYSKAALEKAAATRRVLFFYASWCPTCRPADANFTQNTNKIPEDVTLVRVNYNDPETDQEERDLAKKYGITYQHTFVQIDNTGKEVTKWNGGQIEELLSRVK